MKVGEFIKEVVEPYVVEVEKKRTRYRYKIKKDSFNIYSVYYFLREVCGFKVTCVYKGEFRWLQVPFKFLDKEIPERFLNEFKEKNKEYFKKEQRVKEQEVKKSEEKTQNVYYSDEIRMRLALNIKEACISCKNLQIHERGYYCLKWECIFNIAQAYTCDYFEKKE